MDIKLTAEQELEKDIASIVGAEPEVVKEEPVKEKVEVKPEPEKVEVKPEPVATPDYKQQYEELKARLERIEQAKASTPAPEPKKEAKPWSPKFKAKPEDMEAFIEGGEKAAAVLDQLYTTALQEMAELVLPYIEQQVKEVREKDLAPFRQSYEEQQIARRTTEFTTKYPDLKEDIDEARQVAEALVANPPRQFKDWNDFYDEVAKNTRIMKEKWAKKLGTQPPIKKEDAPKPEPAKGGGPKGSSEKLSDEEALIRSVVGA